MSELDDIRARRAAITLNYWVSAAAPSKVWIGANPVYCIPAADAAFIAAAPGDVDTLLAMVDALTAEVLICHGLLESLTPGGSEFSGWPERCAEWVRERLSTRAQLAAERNMLRAERDALAAQLAQAQRELAAVPTKAIYDCWFGADGRTPDASTSAVEAWLNVVTPNVMR